MAVPKPVVLIIRDGWGIRKQKKDNAIALGKTPNADNYIRKYPTSALKCHGEDVGLPKGYQGSSEVGHLNIGAGRVVHQMITRINHTIHDGSFFHDEAKLWVFFPSAMVLGVLWVTGSCLFLLPYSSKWQKWRIRARANREAPASNSKEPE